MLTVHLFRLASSLNDSLEDSINWQNSSECFDTLGPLLSSNQTPTFEAKHWVAIRVAKLLTHGDTPGH